MKRCAIVLLFLGAGLAMGQESPFGGTDAAAPVAAASPFRAEVAAAPASVAAGSETTLAFRLVVPAGHYVYAERTGIEVLPDPALEVLQVTTPAPVTKRDPFLDEDVQVHERDVEFRARVRLLGPARVRAVVSSQGCSGTICFFPQSDTLAVQLQVVGVASAASGPVVGSAAVRGAPSSAESRRLQAAAERGILWLLALAFGAGLATSFTPCIYPMIPITIGIIGARSAGRRSKGFTLSLLYVLGIAVTYSILGTTAALTGSLFGSILQNSWVVGGVALVFVLMAMSLFGAFELQVPVGFATRMNRVQGSGYPGAFLLGLVAGIVASPCIGPVLVAMLAYVAASGSPVLGFGLFFTFALGLGVLFVVLGTFTGFLTSLPRSGNWMTRVRLAFGLVFLGVALYYLHPLVPRTSTLLPIGLGILALGLGLGALRRIEPTEPPRVRWRKALGRVGLVAGLYACLVPLLERRGAASVPGPAWLASESDGRARARAESKPMLVDFGADWCVACKELEHFTFSDPRVIELALRFVPVHVDATERSPEILGLMERYAILGLPWVAFVTPDGDILQDLTVTGFVPADEMLARMQRALESGAPPGGAP